ncbi:MAG: CocE/NonD family hydrolase [Proteobacteria bacterium]|nr:CocE/NonD family hydrolase [Pseudomonadota bacterium]
MRVLSQFPRPVREIENAWITLSDGCRLAARIWLPADSTADPVPAILEYLPYRKRDFTALGNALMHPYFAGHGYAVARVDRRGSGESDGLMYDEYIKQELDDGLEVIDWLARQPWSTGAVGMMGISWGGFNALQVAALRPPALKAIITACSTDDRYADDMHYMGGCLLNDNLMWGSTAFSFMARPPDPAIVGERWRSMWLDRLRNSESLIATWMQHQRRDAYWQHGSVCEDFSRIQCAVYAVGGWADGYSNAIPRLLSGLKAPRKGLIGPWSHAWPHAGVPGPTIGFLQEALRWWDHWLKGKANGIMEEPMLRAWMQDSVPPRTFYAERPGSWVAEASWPSPEIGSQGWFLNATGLSTDPGEELLLSHVSPVAVGKAAGEWCPYGYAAEMPGDQREDDGNALCFEGAPLSGRLEILGAPVVELEVAVDRPVAMLAVRLNDVGPAGADTRMSYGLLNLTHRDGHDEPQPLVPGRRYRVRIQLNDIGYAIPAGHRLRVAVSTSYWPIAWPSPEPVTLTLVAGKGRLTLPIRRPRKEDAALPPFEAPESAPPLKRTERRPYRRSRRYSHDLVTGLHVVEAVKDRGAYTLDAIGLSIGAAGSERYSIKDGDPLSARAEARYTITMGRGEWQIAIETETIVTATLEDFLVSARLEAFEKECRVFSRSWDTTIPRDLA